MLPNGCALPPTPGFASVPAPPTQTDQNTRETQRSRVWRMIWVKSTYRNDSLEVQL